MHNGFVTVTEKHEKMSKSTGNFFTIRTVTEKYHPLALRHISYWAHITYRSPVNYSTDQLDISSKAIFYIYQTLEDCQSAVSQQEPQKEKHSMTNEAKEGIDKLKSQFEEQMADDLHTPPILNAALQDALRLLLSMLKKKLQKPQKLSYIQSLIELEKQVREVLGVLGLLSTSTYTEVGTP